MFLLKTCRVAMDAGLLRVCRCEAKFWHASIAKNTVHAVAAAAEEDILVNVDADNIAGPGFVLDVDGIHGSVGRIAVDRKTFVLLQGYDEDAYPTGAQDVDLWLRLGMLARQRGQRVERLGPNFRRFFQCFGVNEVKVQDDFFVPENVATLTNDNGTFQAFEDAESRPQPHHGHSQHAGAKNPILSWQSVMVADEPRQLGAVRATARSGSGPKEWAKDRPFGYGDLLQERGRWGHLHAERCVSNLTKTPRVGSNEAFLKVRDAFEVLSKIYTFEQ
eukprot:symbB.v1.2.015451.t2/scaffold1154.1/size134997/2